MFDLTIKLTRAALVIFWLAVALSALALVPVQFAEPILWIGAVLLLLHFVEYLVLRGRIAARQGGDSGFLGTMAFGFGYWLPILRS